MWRLIVTLVLCVSYASPLAADPGQFFQKFFGAVGEIQQYSTKRQQRRRAKLRRLLDACVKFNERACHRIIAAKGMPAAANYLAFSKVMELELQRGEVHDARKSHGHAVKWAKRMPYIQGVLEELRAMEVKLNNATATPQYTARRSPQVTNVTPREEVCLASEPDEWRTACFKARRDARGSILHGKLSELLRSRDTTVREILRCDELIAEEEFAGEACFSKSGLTGDQVQEAQITALEFELIVDSYIAD